MGGPEWDPLTESFATELPDPDDQEPDWVGCLACGGEGVGRDIFDLDIACPDCGGDGGHER